MAEIETAIEARITAHSGLKETLATVTSFYAAVANTDEVKPYLVFTVVSDDKVERTMGSDTAPNEAVVQFSIIAETFAEIVATWIQLKAAFDRWAGTSGSIVVQDTFVEVRNDQLDEGDRVIQRNVDVTFFYED